MKKVIGYILTPVFYFAFGLALGIFHPIQVICWKLWGYPAQKRSVEILNYLLIRSLWILGSGIHFYGFDKLPKGRPLIVISNHQSMFDIPPIVWGFRNHYPKFISKKELGHGIPSISYNLRKGGSALIDRQNAHQALEEIRKLGRTIEDKNYSAVIFPEGTRSRNGQVRTFKKKGIEALLESAPSAWIVPFAINGNYRLQQQGPFPLAVGVKLTYTVLEPFSPAGMTTDEVTALAEKMIKKELGQGSYERQPTN